MRPRVPRQLVDPERAADIRALADAVADDHCPAGAVCPEHIAAAKAITLSAGDYGDAFDGCLESRDGRFHIYLNTARTGPPEAPRSRFTLAHELGHWFLDDHRAALRTGQVPAHRSACEWLSPLLAEQEADLFAAHLLLPTERFTRSARAAARGMDGILALARTYGTSATATALRLAEADVYPLIVIKWDHDGTSWKRLSSSAFAARLGRPVSLPRALPDDSPTRRAQLSRPTERDAPYHQAGSTTAAWFASLAPGSDRDRLLIEQALSLGRYGTLTVLYPPGGSLA